MHTLDSDPVGLKYRCQWSPPLAIDWFDNSVYFGCQVIFRTRDRGQTWEVISKDLSTGDPERIRFSGGVVGDNLGQFYGAVVSAIAPSRTQQGVVWAGTNDGKVWISRDAGKAWTDLTTNVRNADQRRIAEGPSARLHDLDRGESATQGDDLRGHRARVLLFTERRPDVDAVQGQAAGGAGDVD
jgi:hypothetical protein